MRQFFHGVWFLIKLLASILLVSATLVMLADGFEWRHIPMDILMLAFMLMLVSSLWMGPDDLYTRRKEWQAQVVARAKILQGLQTSGQPITSELLREYENRFPDPGPFPGYPINDQKEDPYSAMLDALYQENERAMNLLSAAGSDRRKWREAYQEATRLQGEIHLLQGERHRWIKRRFVKEIISLLAIFLLISCFLWFLPSLLQYLYG